MVIDPVCKMSLVPEDAAATADYAGRTYYFCSKSCHAKFAANPAAFAAVDSQPSRDGGVGAEACAMHTAVPPERARRALIAQAGSLGVLAAAALLVLYFGVVSLVSGWEFMLDQFSQFWYFVIPLALGFGVQVGLYTYLRNAVHAMHGSGKVVAVSGTTSGAAMVSCCAHYLVNLLPALGATGLITLIGQYQVQLFWFGLAANAAGIAYVGQRVVHFAKEA
jgi:Cu+-exporting ATPase